MAETTLTPSPLPEIVPPATTTHVVNVSPAQVWSAAAQNIAIAGCITAAYFTGKCPMEVWIAALSYLAGVDLFGRKIAAKSGAMALAVGATGAFSALGRMVLVFGLATSLTMASGCGADLSAISNQVGIVLNEVQAAHNMVIEARQRAEDVADVACKAPLPAELEGPCAKLRTGLLQAQQLTDDAADAGNLARELYNAAVNPEAP